MMKYYIDKTLTGKFDEVEEAVRKALKTEGFGIVTELNLSEKLREKLKINYRKYLILGACNPTYAFSALEYEDKIGTMLPCNVIIQELKDGKVEIAAVDPIVSMKAVNNEKLVAIAYEIKEKLKRVIDSVEINKHSNFYF